MMIMVFFAAALQLELVASSVMATEDGEQGSGVIMTVSGRGQTVRPVTVSLVTFDLTATGIKSLLSNLQTLTV